MNGHFIFDDLSLPFSLVTREGSLREWMSNLRPILMLTYWVNYHCWGVNPFSYHLLSLSIHMVNGGLVFLVLSRLLAKAGWPVRKARIASAIGAAVFLVHPLQTESVSYIAGRSESLATLFLLLAYVVFLYRRNEAIAWREVLLVVILFGAGVKTKENAISLAGILVLTDLFWPEPFSLRGIRLNWRLYSVLVPGGIAGAVLVFRSLGASATVGFSLVTFKWYQYAFTEARAIFTYMRLAVLPFGQSLDHDFAPSHTIMEHGAIFYMIVLAALVVTAVVWRRRYPLFCFGLLVFLICLAPTSSIVPLDDPLVERRMYLALLGLILMGCEAGGRLHVSRTAWVGILAFLGLILCKLCYDRNQLWGEPNQLIEMAADNASNNPRPLLNYTDILIRTKHCELAPAYLERAERRLPNNYYVNAAWGKALACLGRYDEAIARLQTAARIQPCSQVYEWLGLVYSKVGVMDKAGEALKKAVQLGPTSESAHGSLALWFENVKDFPAAEQEYRAALSLNRRDTWAQARLLRVQAMTAGH